MAKKKQAGVFTLNMKPQSPKGLKGRKGKALIPGLSLSTRPTQATVGRNVTNVKSGLKAAERLGKQINRKLR